MSDRFRIRDLSWLDFNARVLQEAQDETVPLFERIRFLAIYSSNLDEFFRVRVAGMRNLLQLGKKEQKRLLYEPAAVLDKIYKEVGRQQDIFGQVFRNEIMPALEEHGIYILDETQLMPYQETWARKKYFDLVRPHIHPRILSAEDAPYFLQNRTIYLLIELTRPDEREVRHLGMIEIPTRFVPRFFVLPGREEDRHSIMILDDLVRLSLPLIYPDWITGGSYSIKLTRSGELDWGDEEEGDLVDKIRHSLEKRSINPPTRFLYDHRLPAKWFDDLASYFQLPHTDFVAGGRYHNFSDFFAFPNPAHKRLNYRPLPPQPHPRLERADSIMRLLRQEGDQLLHLPYQKFDYFIRWLNQAAEDPNVTAIFLTLYRVAGDSQVVHALLRAQRRGKRVVCFFEVKARFDEESNLFWAGEMERAGAEVYYSLPGLKVHTKTALVERNEEGETRRYAYIGTGNLNEKTAKQYADMGLFTADAQLAREVRQIFTFLIEHKTHRYEDLLVAPNQMRNRLYELIEAEQALAGQGQKAWMILKMNSLEDREMIRRLYRAAEAGVQIDLIIRGICCLDPTLPSLQGRIRAISIVDRFLEHTRVFIFGNGGASRVYLSSADLMRRNLDHRVECAFPIKDPVLQQEVIDIIRIQLQDNARARLLGQLGENPYVQRPARARIIRSQLKTYAYLRKKLRDARRLHTS